MVRLLYILLFSGVLLYSCKPQEEQLTTDSGVLLRFSQDTVLFDTLLSSIGSVTKRFKVYNDNEKAVFTNIDLAKSFSSDYKIWVNGVQATQYSDVMLFGKDSMLVLVEVKIDPQDKTTPYLVNDAVLFQTNGNLQNVMLVAYGQDANFLKDSTLACNTTWISGKAYVVMGKVTVPLGCNLTIDQGTKVYFDYKASLHVEGNLTVTGASGSPVLFCNANDISEQPEKALGYWEGLTFSSTSTSNSIDWALIKNAEHGIYYRAGSTVDSLFELTIDHSRIENMSQYGIKVFGIDMSVLNSSLSNCANALVQGYGGGNYNFIHVSGANYGFDFFRTGPAFRFNNQATDQGIDISHPLEIGIENTIVWGSARNEIEQVGATQYYAGYSLFKTINVISGAGNIFNQDPYYLLPMTNDLRLRTISPAVNKGNATLSLPVDLNGDNRVGTPEMGAYELQP